MIDGRFTLPPEQRDALIKLDLPTIVKMGAHPLVPLVAQIADEAPAAAGAMYPPAANIHASCPALCRASTS